MLLDPMIHSWAVLLLALAGCLGGAPEPRAGSERPPPDIILVTVDTWRADRLHLYGGARENSPALERLAADAVVFERAQTAATWTLASMTSVMTGLHPDAHTVSESDRALPSAVDTVAERLAAGGYETAFFGVNTYLMPPRRLDQGFETYRAWEGLDGRQLVQIVAGYLDQRGGERPLFLQVHLYDPHCPYRAPRDLSGAYRPVTGALATGQRLRPEDWTSMPDCYQLRADGAAELELDTYLAAYDEELLSTDRVLGDLFATLGDRGLLEEALLIVAGDHGEAFWEHGDYGHGREVYQTTARVPLVLRPPGGRAGRVAATVSLVDIAPTVLTAAGLPVPALLPGRDLSPAWGAGLSPAPAFTRTRYESADASAVLSGALALVLTGPGASARLYDLSADPGEREDRAAQQPERLRQLQALLDDRSRADSAAARELSPVVLAPSEDVLQQLRSIGYIH